MIKGNYFKTEYLFFKFEKVILNIELVGGLWTEQALAQWFMHNSKPEDLAEHGG